LPGQFLLHEPVYYRGSVQCKANRYRVDEAQDRQ
jgi:hypothetical protein